MDLSETGNGLKLKSVYGICCGEALLCCLECEDKWGVLIIGGIWWRVALFLCFLYKKFEKI